MQNIVDDIRQIKIDIQTHELECDKIKASGAYQNLETEIAELMERKVAMLPETDLHSLFRDKKAIILEAVKNGSEFDNVTPKYKEKKEVNTTMFMEALGGDFGLYQELSSVTQKSLKDFAKTQPGMKKPLMNCIEVISRELTDIEIT